MHRVSSRKRAYVVGIGLLISLLLFVACSGSGSEPTTADETEFETRVAVAVEETVSALTVGNTEQAANVDQSVDQSTDQSTEEAAAAPTDNSRAIVDYLLANGRHFTGNPDADVVIIEFSDFQ